jgi:hypothetical protein
MRVELGLLTGNPSNEPSAGRATVVKMDNIMFPKVKLFTNFCIFFLRIDEVVQS